MYRVVGELSAFYVDNEEKAKKYAKEGYDVFQVIKLKLNDNDEFETDEPNAASAATGGING